MRVWLAPSRYAPHTGGVETATADLAAGLTRAGHEVLVVTHRYPDDLPRDELPGGVRVRRIDFAAPARAVGPAVRFVSSAVSVPRQLARLARPDVINLQGCSSQTWHLERYARRARVPLVVTTHGELTADDQDLYGRSRFARASFRAAVGRAARLTAPSSHALAEAVALAPAGERIGQVLPNPVDVEFWAAVPPPTASAVVLTWGRLEQVKGVDRLIDAWPLVLARRPDAELRIAGDGAQLGALRARAGDGVRFLGRLNRSQVAEALGHAQLAAVPSRRESFGLAAAEALAAGRRVVHAGLPALSDLIGQHGTAVDHDTPELLAGALHAELAAGPRRVPPGLVDRCAVGAVTAAYVAVYEQACSQSSRR